MPRLFTPRHLWLVFERPPHPEAVSYPAGEEDLRLVLDALQRPYPQRRHLAEQLRNFLASQQSLPLFGRERVPMRLSTGLYHPVAWRLACWLARVLPAPDSAIQQTIDRIRRWLEQEHEQPQVLNPRLSVKQR
ncbi:MAG: hypothetical protein KY476_10325 [Planctomycetes bacterium]|nr:hypothetical protein [Planctomycetota bacterium]